MQYARVFMGDDWQNRSPADFLLAVWTIPAWQWTVPFVAATAVYLIGSAMVLAVDRPLWWVVGIWFLSILVAMVSQGALERSIEILVLSKYGLATLLTGDTFQSLDIASLDLAAPGEQGTFDTILHTREGGSVVHRMPDLQAWLLSVLLWMGSGIIGLTAAIQVRKDDVA